MSGVRDGGGAQDGSMADQGRRRAIMFFTCRFIPGNLIMALSMGMNIAPKLSIYNELICRALGSEKAGTTVPAPADSNLGNGYRPHEPWVGGPNKPVSDVPEPTLAHPVNAHFDEGHVQHVIGVNTFVKRALSKARPSDDWATQCRRSPAVSSAVSDLNTKLALLMGILSSVTTGFWGALSDRRGRRPVLCLAIFGTVVMDTVFLTTVKFHTYLPGGYYFLLVGPAIDGLLGGMSTTTATINAYLSDCTDPGSRARIFSVMGGVMMAGIALGPVVGSVLIKLSGSNLLPFYVALAVHAIYLLVVWLVLPESLSLERQKEARHRHKEEVRVRVEATKASLRDAKAGGRVSVGLHRATELALRPFSTLRPLMLLLPRKRSLDEVEQDRPAIELLSPPRAGWDFALTKIALGWALYVLTLAIISFMLVYTGRKFGWGPAENGYFLSYLGFTRVLVLLGFLPLMIRLFRPKVPLPKRDRPEGADSSPKVKEWEKEAKALRVVADGHFDLFLARFSVFADALAYLTIALNGGSQVQFLVGAAMQALGGGAGPAVQSLALAHAAPRDAGRLFASLSVLQSISSSILGPLVFNAVFSRTVGTWPEAMFWLAVGLYVVSFGCLMLVRLQRRVGDAEVGVGGGVDLLGDEGEGEGEERVEVFAGGGAEVAGGVVKVKKSVAGAVKRGSGDRDRGRSSTRRPGTSSAGASAITLAGVE